MAVRRAIALAAPDTELAFLSVVWRVGAGPTQRASLGVARAEEALAAACARAADASLSCQPLLAHSPEPAQTIFRHAAGHDLLVLGGPVASRASGMLSGSVASFAAHRAPGPVLLARGADVDAPFPERIVVASDGSSEAELALDAVADLACGRFVTVTLAYVDGHAPDERLAEEAESLHERLGFAPDVVMLTGTPHEALAAFARESGADLLVTGSRGLRGLRALASTSERAAHVARTSVLIVRPRCEDEVRPELVHAAHDQARRLRARALVEPPAPR